MVDRDLLKPHSFDGIQEYDNDLPRWWLAILGLSVVWAVLYIAYYHIEGAPLGPELLAKEIAQATEERLANSTGPLSEELLIELSHNSERIAAGKAIFLTSQCITCHGPEGNGMIGGNPGPGANLRDAYWLHGSTMTDIIHTITEGFLEKGMPPQKGLLSENEIINVACFITDQARKPIPGKAHDPDRDQEHPITQ
jgi:cytochrome c oxidase cbb3-type subunit III